MARKKKTELKADHGRGFYETSSPFETYRPGADNDPAWKGQTDQSVEPSKTLRGNIPGTRVIGEEQAKQYDNPRGYPGLALIQVGDQKPKLPYGKKEHGIFHTTEEGSALSRTGKPGGK